MGTFAELSRGTADAVAGGAAFTVCVDGRRLYPVSGVVFDDRHVLTLDHAVEREDDIWIRLPDGGRMSAKVRGRDRRSDLVLLATEADLGVRGGPATEAPVVGQLVVAVGRPDGETEAVLGMVSAVGGPLRLPGGTLVEAYLAIDALRVQGFSGGPVVDVAGGVLGITMNAVREARAFAISAAPAWAIARLLLERGTLDRGYLGIRSQPAALGESLRSALGREQETGLLVVGVERQGAAEEAGVMVGDILLGFDGRPVAEHEDLVAALGPEVVGRPVAVQIGRGGRVERLQIRPGAAPS